LHYIHYCEIVLFFLVIPNDADFFSSKSFMVVCCVILFKMFDKAKIEIMWEKTKGKTKKIPPFPAGLIWVKMVM